MSETHDWENQSTILIVDDEPYILKTFETILRNEGYHLVLASNGVQALEIAAEVKPDVVLLDVMMPGMQGYEVCRRLRADPLQAEVPIILITALGDHESRRKGLEAGADDFLTKPIDRHGLRTRLKIITRLNRYRRLLAERMERQRVEAALQQSQQKYQMLVETMSDGFGVLDEQGRITYANQRFAEILGYTADELIGRTGFDLLGAQVQAQMLAYSSGQRECVPQPSEVSITRPDRSQIWVRISPTPIFSADEIYRGTSAVITDITQRVNMERELRQLTQKVISAQEDERERLSRELHDEAGQALTALKISLELIRSDLPAEYQELAQRLLSAIELTDTTTERIRLLSQDLRPPSLDTIGLNPTLEGYCRDFAERTRIQVDYECAGLPPLSDTIRISVYRVLQEALTNVARHAQASQVRIRCQYKDGFIELEVVDDGEGFDPQSRTLGIGLVGMKERVELLAGRFSVESDKGEGTQVIVQIPWSMT